MGRENPRNYLEDCGNWSALGQAEAGYFTVGHNLRIVDEWQFLFRVAIATFWQGSGGQASQKLSMAMGAIVQ